MNYLDLLRLVSPEAIVVITALVVLAIGLTSGNKKNICTVVCALGLVAAAVSVLMLPAKVSAFGGMIVISPLTSLFKLICLGLAFLTVLLTQSEKSLRHH